MKMHRTISLIDDTVRRRIQGVTWKGACPVPIEDLRYLRLSYYGFDGKSHLGEMVVSKHVADDVVAIFTKLYGCRFPIDKMKLVDDYHGDDTLSMADNNTSGFNYRYIAGTDTISMHGYGLAIDINTVQNPYMYKGVPHPRKSAVYVDRSNVRKGMIEKDDICYQAFISRGWTWGGDWKGDKDYQHFQKAINKPEYD